MGIPENSLGFEVGDVQNALRRCRAEQFCELNEFKWRTLVAIVRYFIVVNRKGEFDVWPCRKSSTFMDSST